MGRADTKLLDGLIYHGLVLCFGRERADRWYPRVPYVLLALLIVFVLAVFAAVMVFL